MPAVPPPTVQQTLDTVDSDLSGDEGDEWMANVVVIASGFAEIVPGSILEMADVCLPASSAVASSSSSDVDSKVADPAQVQQCKRERFW